MFNPGSYIAEKVKANPSRFAAFAAVSMHDPKQAAQELSRAVMELGCVGVMINDFQSSGPDGNVSPLIPSLLAPNSRVEVQTMLFYDNPSYDVCALISVLSCGAHHVHRYFGRPWRSSMFSSICIRGWHQSLFLMNSTAIANGFKPRRGVLRTSFRSTSWESQLRASLTGFLVFS